MDKINIAELLKDCPKGMELDCALYDDVTLSAVSDNRDYKFPIKIAIGANRYRHLTKTGGYDIIPESKCVIYPKGKTTWEGFQRPFKDGDILVSKAKQPFIFQSFNSNNGCCSYCGIDAALQFRLHSDDWAYVNFLRFATEEELIAILKVIGIYDYYKKRI